MHIYLAAMYSRKAELVGYKKQLEELGHTVTSRWLTANDESTEAGPEWGQWALRDTEDIPPAHIIISFTQDPKQLTPRGSRHVEFGIGLALKKRMIVVGPRENVFHWLPGVEQYDTWDECYEHLRRTLIIFPPLGNIQAKDIPTSSEENSSWTEQNSPGASATTQQ